MGQTARHGAPKALMKLHFLGTGSAEGMPALFCSCAVCAQARRRGGPDRRTRASVLLDDVVKIDLPPDTLAHVHAYDLDLSMLRHLLFTHSHDDHFAVRELQYLSPHFAPGRRRHTPLHVWATRGLIQRMLLEMAHFFEKAPLCFHALVPFVEEPVGHLHITPFPAHHKSDELCLNFLVRQDERVLLYATDTGWYDEASWDFLLGRRIDAVALECGKGISTSGYDGHLNIEDVRRYKERLHHAGGLAPDAPFWVTHIAHTGLLLHEEMTGLLAPDGITVAYDGLQASL